MTNSNVITNSAEYGLIPQCDFFDKDIAVDGNTDKYYIIENGDFVYNPRKSSTAPYGPFNCYRGLDEGIVSPLYTCLKPLRPELTDYLLWYFRSSAWHSYIYHNGAQGGARHDRVGMTNDLMDGIPINLPCLDEQKKISEFLSLLENRLTAQQKIVDALKSYKRGVLSILFASKTVCDDPFVSWEEKSIADLLSYEQPQKYIVTSEHYSTDYNTPVLTANKGFILGYTSETNSIYDKGDVIIYDDFTMDMKYVTFPFKVKSSTIKMLTAKPGNNLYFLFSLLQSLKLTPEGHQRSYISKVEPMLVRVPPLNEQNHIARILKKIADLLEREELTLTQLFNLKAGLLQELFI